MDLFQIEIKNHVFFSPINWDDLNAKKITPPFNPNVVRSTLILRLLFSITATVHWLCSVVACSSHDLTFPSKVRITCCCLCSPFLPSPFRRDPTTCGTLILSSQMSRCPAPSAAPRTVHLSQPASKRPLKLLWASPTPLLWTPTYRISIKTPNGHQTRFPGPVLCPWICILTPLDLDIPEQPLQQLCIYNNVYTCSCHNVTNC